MDPLQHPTVVPALLLLTGLLVGCAGEDATTSGPEDAPTEAAVLEIEWLDDEDLARSAAFHQLGGRIQAAASAEEDLPRLARQALVARAESLGFRRLDNLQFSVSCGDEPDGDDASGEMGATGGETTTGAASEAEADAGVAATASTPADGSRSGCRAEIAAIASR